MNEIWKDIAGYEGHYQASNTGKIRSLDKEVSGRGGSIRKIYGKVLSATDDGKGYLKVAFQTDGRKTRRLFKVHRLIALAFLAKPSQDNFEVNHKDGDKTNNHIDNLEWSTPSENMQHAIKTNLQDRSAGSKKTKVALLKADGSIDMVFDSIASANEFMNFPSSGSGISDNINGRNKSYKNTNWKKV